MNIAQRRPGEAGPALGYWLLFPIVAVNLLAFILPMFNLSLVSFRQSRASGGMGDNFSLSNWLMLVSDAFYSEILLRTIYVSALITGLTLLVSYPIAFFIHRSGGRWRTLLIVMVISPLLTSAVVRTFGWIALLQDGGVISQVLAAIGLPQTRLIYNMSGVMIGLTEIMMPYMILALLAGFGRLDERLEEAANSLGANPIRVFWRVILPLTAPGIALGSLLCFVLSVSSFVTPKILGGGRVFLLATEIYDQAIISLNWPVASALSIVVLILFGAALFLYGRMLKGLQ